MVNRIFFRGVFGLVFPVSLADRHCTVASAKRHQAVWLLVGLAGHFCCVLRFNG
jgi:hypothetical protein